MKCRVCGQELDPQKNYCDKCGTLVSESRRLNDGEFSWNTIDFPKPKKPKDIEMNWNTGRGRADSYMSSDASEGFVTRSDPEPLRHQSFASQQGFDRQAPGIFEQPQESAAPPAFQQAPPMQYMPPQPMAWTMPSSAWTMPAQQQVMIPQPYNVVPQPVQTAAPPISPMPQPCYQQFSVPQNTLQVPSQQPVQQPAQSFYPQYYMTQPVFPQAPAAPQPPLTPQSQEQFSSALQSREQAPLAPQSHEQTASALQGCEPLSPAPQNREQAPLVPPSHAQTAYALQGREQFSSAPEYLKTDGGPAERLDAAEAPKAAFRGHTAKDAAPERDDKPVPGSQELDSWLDDQLKDDPRDSERFFTFYKKNEEFQKLLDEEYQRYKSKYDTNAESLKRSQVIEASKKAEPFIEKAAPAEDRTMIYHTRPEHRLPKSSEEFSQPSDKVFSEQPVTDFDKMIFEGTTNTGELGEATLAISNAELRREIDELAQKVEEAYACDKNKRAEELQSMAEARSKFFLPSDTAELDDGSSAEIKSIFDKWDQERREAEEAEAEGKKKHGFLSFILVLLIIISLFVAVDIACVSFLSEGPVYEFCDKLNSRFFESFDRISEKFKGDKKPDEPAPELSPVEKAAMEVNKNIEKISFDAEASRYSSQGEYEFKNLGAASVLDDEETVLAITKIIVAFNSTWIDYVNTKNDISCFDYLKADGAAFRAASSFDISGKTEKFLKLNIGEMRKDANFIYVFVDENIEVTVNGSTQESPGRVVYKLTPVGDTYKIVESDNYN